MCQCLSYLLGFFTPCLAASPQFLALPSLHLQRTKTRKGGEVGRRVWVEWGVGRVKWLERLGAGDARVDGGWSEGGMKGGMWSGECCQKIDAK